MWPSVMGMTYALLPEEKAGLAGGLVIGVAGLGNATGPLTAGFLTDTFSWRWIFFLNVPIALLAIVVTRRFVKESASGAREPLDYQGIAALSAALVLILVALDIGGQNGVSASVAVMLATGVVLVAFFVGIERRQGSAALIPRRVISRRTFASSVASVLLMSWTLFAIIVYVPQYLEKNLGWSALAAGAGLLPLMLVFAVASFIVPRSGRAPLRPVDRSPPRRSRRPGAPPPARRCRPPRRR